MPGVELEQFLRTNIDLAAGAPPLFLDLREIGAFVPVRFEVVVVGNGVDSRESSRSPSEDAIGHRDDGGRVHASAQFSQDGCVRTEPAADRLGEDLAVMLFILAVGPVANDASRIEIPILLDGAVPGG